MTSPLAGLQASIAWSEVGRTLCIDGPTPLRGSVDVQGSKNAAQKIVPMCALVPGMHHLRRVPLIRDTIAVLRVIEHLGGTVAVVGNEMVVDTRNLVLRSIPRALTVGATGTFHFAGALLGRFGCVEIAPPGGDDIGARPVDLHLRLFELLGARVQERAGVFVIHMTQAGADVVRLPIPSAGVFVNSLQVASAAAAPVRIENGPIDADTLAALDFARHLGARVEYSTQDGVAVTEVYPRGVAPSVEPFELPADRNDAATWLMAPGITRGDVVVQGVDVVELRRVLAFLRGLGAVVEERVDAVRVDCSRGLDANDYELVLGPSPGFHSDWGPIAQAVLARAEGVSVVEDRMYERRYRHVEELKRLGAAIAYFTRPVPPGALMFDEAADEVTALRISGGAPWTGTSVTGRDVRGAAALALAGTAARGTTRLSGLDQLGRGYERFPERLAALGAQVYGSAPATPS